MVVDVGMKGKEAEKLSESTELPSFVALSLPGSPEKMSPSCEGLAEVKSGSRCKRKGHCLVIVLIILALIGTCVYFAISAHKYKRHALECRTRHRLDEDSMDMREKHKDGDKWEQITKIIETCVRAQDGTRVRVDVVCLKRNVQKIFSPFPL